MNTHRREGASVRMALVNGLRPAGSADLYEDLAGRLRARGLEVELIEGAPDRLSSPEKFDILVSNMDVEPGVRARIPVYAHRRMSRPDSLRLLEQSGVPTMDWALARTRSEVRALFEKWGAERVLLKRSFSYGGKGTCVFTRGAVWRLRWKRELDVFCREVNPDSGDVYKVELLGGRVLIAWKSTAPPIRALFGRGIRRGLRGAYGERSVWELPASLSATLTSFSAGLTENGLSHVSVDLMRRADGELVAIEINPGGVATWWTRQFPDFRERYTEALYAMALRHRPEPRSRPDAPL